MPSSRGLSQPRDQTQVPYIADRFFTSWATREAQEHWSGFPIPSPGDLPNPGIEPGSPTLQADSLPAELPGKPLDTLKKKIYIYIYIHILNLPIYLDNDDKYKSIFYRMMFYILGICVQPKYTDFFFLKNSNMYLVEHFAKCLNTYWQFHNAWHNSKAKWFRSWDFITEG